ncbi:MAG: hypothetical protein LBH11_02905 [Propionibacteriaceae bacterium]|jgi:hypothetical protein|nr:hypothetical protein [Propionibacteriaceae bacterium]
MIGIRDVAVEAWRNISSGTTRAFVALGVFMTLVGGIGLLQVRVLVAVAQQAVRFDNSGASVQVLAATGRINGAQCDALATYPGIAAAGAVRQGPDVRLAALPTTALHTFEATPGLGEVLSVATTAETTAWGVWLAEELAEVLGVDDEPALLPLVAGVSLNTTGVFAYPSDGRLPVLSYTLISPVPALGMFDACWVRVWPENDGAFALLTLPWQAAGFRDASDMPRPQQLNTTLGISFDAERRLAAEPVWPLTFAGIGVGAVLGFAMVRVRRLELAAALHAGMDKASLLAQVGLETCVWVALAWLSLAPALGMAASIGNPDPFWVSWYPGLRTASCAGIAVLLGAGTAVLLTQEQHLFRYFKQR